ncbi:MAG: type II secretion system protein [Verrucomicrobiota bacterium]
MKVSCYSRPRGFTLLETVIAIGVLAVLLTGFMVVFAPAAEGIRKSINVQQADRLASTLEQELVTLRGTESASLKTGFNKAYDWIKASDQAASGIMVYQYRGRVGGTPRADGTPEPEPLLKDKLPGKDYVVVPMVRRLSDPEFRTDLTAVDGAVYLVKCTQLIFAAGELKLGTAGTIKDPKGLGADGTNGDTYPEAVIAFSADFFIMPSKSDGYFSSAAYTTKFPTLKNPVFSRNLAVRR